MVSKIAGRQRASGHRGASAVITAALATVSFPRSKTDLVKRVGDRPVEVVDGTVVPLGDVLKQLPVDEFADASSTVDAIDAHWQEFRAAVGAQEPPPEPLTEPGSSGR